MEYQKNIIEILVENAYIDMFKNNEKRVELAAEYGDLNLNNFWHRDKFLDFWGLAKMPYNQHYHEEKHGDVKFLLADNLHFENDSSHYARHGVYAGQTKAKDMGNDIVLDFFMTKPSRTLDLTWMKPKDIFRLSDNIQYNALQNVNVNVDNLAESSLHAYFNHYESDEDLSLNLIVNAQKTKMKAEEQVAAFRNFFANQNEHISSYHIDHVTLDGFSKSTYKTINAYLGEKGIDVSKRKQLTIEPNVKALKNEQTQIMNNEK